MSFKYVIKSQNGIHARPAGVLVNMVKQYSECKIELGRIESSTFSSASQILSVMGLCLKKGDQVVFRITGTNEEVEYHVKNELCRLLAEQSL